MDNLRQIGKRLFTLYGWVEMWENQVYSFLIRFVHGDEFASNVCTVYLKAEGKWEQVRRFNPYYSSLTSVMDELMGTVFLSSPVFEENEHENLS